MILVVDVLDKLGYNTEAAGTLTTFQRLAQIAGKLGANTDGAGTSTVFARLAQIAAYVDTVETALGQTSDAANASGSANAKLAYLIANGAYPLGLVASGSLTTSSGTYVTAYSTTGKGRLNWLACVRGATDIIGGTVKVTIDGIATETTFGDSTAYILVTPLYASTASSGGSSYDMRFKSSLTIEILTNTKLTTLRWFVEKS